MVINLKKWMNMRKNKKYISIIITLSFFLTTMAFTQENKVILSGKVTDYDGNPIDSAIVLIKDQNFKDLYTTFSDTDGKYSVEVEKGTYYGLASVRMQDYGKTKLEFWAWNLMVDNNMNLDIKYDKLEVYGVNVFRVQGAYPGYTIYFRPMVLSRYFEENTDQNNPDLAPEKENLDIQVYINDEPVQINLIQQVKEFAGKDTLNAYLVDTELGNNKDGEKTKIRLVLKDKKYGDMGEAYYFIDN
jgi:hypothetical protein